ncbi:MAG: hypothetical protein WA979_12075 [Pacificimonas sp.]
MTDKDEEIAALFAELAGFHESLSNIALWIFEADEPEERRAGQYAALREIESELRMTVDRLKESLIRHNLLDVSRLAPSTLKRVPDDMSDDEIPF